MDENMSAQNSRDGQGVAHLGSTNYNLFILTLIVFSWMVMAGLLVGPNTDQVIWRVDFFACVVLFADFLRNLWRAPSAWRRKSRPGYRLTCRSTSALRGQALGQLGNAYSNQGRTCGQLH